MKLNACGKANVQDSTQRRRARTILSSATKYLKATGGDDIAIDKLTELTQSIPRRRAWRHRHTDQVIDCIAKFDPFEGVYERELNRLAQKYGPPKQDPELGAMLLDIA